MGAGTTLRAAAGALLAVAGALLAGFGCTPTAPSAGAGPEVPAGAQPARVLRVVDGDTVHLEGRGAGPLAAGRDDTVRLLAVDTPEVSGGEECFGAAAREELRRLLPVGSTARVAADRDLRDRYGRALLYVWTDSGVFVNLELVTSGHATALLVAPNDRYLGPVRAAETQARVARRGLWAACRAPPAAGDAAGDGRGLVSGAMAPEPSGPAYELVRGDARVVVVEVGCGLRSFDIGCSRVVDGYGAQEMATAGRGQLLLPWPNRVEGGRYRHRGRELQLALTEPKDGNASHGLTRWVRWSVRQSAPDSVTGSYLIPPQPGYPFSVECSASYALADDGLSVTMSLTNRSAEPVPAGMGAHPYLAVGNGIVDGVGAGVVDAAALTVPARTRLHSDERGIPRGSGPVEGTEFDFRRGRPVGGLVIDTAYGDLDRDPDGLARVVLAAPGRPPTTLWCDETWDHLMVFTGDTVPEPERRRRGLAVEPMTCAPDAFNNGRGLRVLHPGETLAGRWGITVG